ncbi:MAG: ADP-forming succinate--CoA ligase subunit beta [Verrucomicrobiota bacterium]|nr:MAG: ADP-forming succinate--CoA ligase subunit beta [Verrucomicrobiota bacterium]
MNIHEFQAKELFVEYNIPTTEGLVIRSLSEIPIALERFPEKAVIKAQIHAGGRGKGTIVGTNLPGVYLARSAEDTARYIQQTLGGILVTNQTGSQGKRIRALYLCDVVEVEHEYYLSVQIDRNTAKPMITVSRSGGVEIEVNAGNLNSISVDLESNIHTFQIRALARALELERRMVPSFIELVSNLCRLFHEKDATLIEINPLSLTSEGALIALDAKVILDDNALYRHPELEALRDMAEDDPLEECASRFGMNYVAAEGDIACVVNGAGLAMATMDMITFYGGKAANFLDLGSRADPIQVREALRIVQENPNTRGIFVNIFGGIAQCDVIAEGILEQCPQTMPVVVRLQGASAERGQQLLREGTPSVILENDLDQAVKTIVSKVKER